MVLPRVCYMCDMYVQEQHLKVSERLQYGEIRQLPFQWLPWKHAVAIVTWITIYQQCGPV